MKYDFTSIIDRRGFDATAIEGIGHKRWGSEPDAPKEGFDPISMWVADMNFATCPAIPKAIIKRAEHPLFGYFFPREEYYQSIIDWRTKRDGFVGLEKEYIGYENGVHGCISSAVKTFSVPGDKILLHSPTYVGFIGDMELLGRTPVYSPLVLDENGIWRMDYEDMEKKIRENNVHLVIFCSPHNPAGRVWERWELEKAMKIFEENECLVISDEIWADITYTGHKHIPTLMVNDWAREHTVAIYAPSKTFNLAGLVGSYHIIYNKYLRDRVCAQSGSTNYNEMNVLSMHALLGAYSEEGTEWVSELLQVLEGNCRYAYEHIRDCYEGVHAAMPQGTYMLFLDLTENCKRTGRTQDEILKAGWDVGVSWQEGRGFRGPCHIRMNVASPFSRIQEAFARLDEYVFHV
ncbi:MAG: aminotransferase class I/II-fold pyridoxal phosphate-dependent enzyme [Clostridiales bacterium]|nr:aminotransferase class I/II-fold pyridoxal phosphate-dependent enzyme [Clostridiales bacterium]